LYDYPGNVRELRNLLFIAATHSRQGEIDAAIVDELLQQHEKSMAQHEQVVTAENQQTRVNLPAKKDTVTLHAAEAQHITGLLRQHNNNRR
jgi:DNA-binding NtrC family response regulator